MNEAIYTRLDWMTAMDHGEQLPRTDYGHQFKVGHPVYVSAPHHSLYEYVGDVIGLAGGMIWVDMLGVGEIWMNHSFLSYDNRIAPC